MLIEGLEKMFEDMLTREPIISLVESILGQDCHLVAENVVRNRPGEDSGQHPNDKRHPTFDGNAPVPIFCRAGDIYLHNGQCWHRGTPNTSDRTRYLFQLSFGMRWVSQRFFPFVNYQLPPHVLAHADDRRKRVLGIHPKGAYG